MPLLLPPWRCSQFVDRHGTDRSEGHTSSTSYALRKIEQRQAAEGGAGVDATKLLSILKSNSFPRGLSTGTEMNSKLEIHQQASYPVTTPAVLDETNSSASCNT
jgi:hypothetical protein